MKKLFLPAFLAICLCVVSGAAQDSLPINTKTKAITDLRPLMPSAENRKPLLINFWATWCGPCRYEFPEFVKIDAEYREKGLNSVVVSIDNLGAMDLIVADFLRVYQSTMPSYLLDLNPNQASRAIRQIAPKTSYGIPLTLLFNKKGKLVYQKSGVVDSNILRSKIDKVLGVKTESAAKVQK